jgi:acetoacetate decarboxylase
MNMSYPPAPWHLDGNALLSVHAIDLATAKEFVPIDLEIVSVLPGKTVGALYLSVYEADSTLQYHELIVVPALVRYRGKIGAWISHIYVDNPDSVAGGINIWELPKELADFTWNDREVTVAQGDRALCQVRYDRFGLPLTPWGNIALSGDVFGGLAADILMFRGDVKGSLKWIPFDLNIPAESPFSTVNMGHPWFSIQCDRLQLTANAPTIVGQWVNRAVDLHPRI